MVDGGSIATAEGIFRDNERRKGRANKIDHAGAASFAKKSRCPTCGNTGMVVDSTTGRRKSCPNPKHKRKTT